MRVRAELNKNPVEGFSAGLKDDNNVFVWEVMIMGPPDSSYEGGFFQATLTFPTDYPNMPPKLKFESDFYHPNVYPDGTVCISILHAPGDDRFGYEAAAERWLPIHTVESILVSVISMISSPNLDSPANIDAAVRANILAARAAGSPHDRCLHTHRSRTTCGLLFTCDSCPVLSCAEGDA